MSGCDCYKVDELRIRKVSLGNDSLNSVSDDDVISDNNDYDVMLVSANFFNM